MPIEDIMGRSRKGSLPFARMVYYLLCTGTIRFGRYALPIITVGQSIKRSHATVLNGLMRANEMLDVDKAFKANYKRAQRLFNRLKDQDKEAFIDTSKNKG